MQQNFLIALYRISHNRHVYSTGSYNLQADIDRAMDEEIAKTGVRRGCD
jgi:hypothetical protein